MKNYSLKGSVTTIICAILIIILSIALVIVGYLGFGKKEKTVNAEVKTELQENNQEVKTDLSKVPTSDLVTLFYSASQENVSIFYGYIEDGSLYYIKDSKSAHAKGDFVSSFITGSKAYEMQKYTGLDNIKRMKTYNVGMDVNPVPFLITEDGKVYEVNMYDGFNVKIFEKLADYKVEDILSFEYEWETDIEVLLKDGTTKRIQL